VCGFVGLIGSEPAAASRLTFALQAIQHRGQDAAGVGSVDDGRFHLVKGMGFITQAVPAERVPGLKGRAGIAHVRYPTAGARSTGEDAQPFLTRRPGILLAHNGNVTNVPEVKARLREQGLYVLSECDAEPILMVLAQELTALRPARHTIDDVAAAVGRVFERVRGAYSVVAVMEVDGRETLVAFRDPRGIRPGVYGRRGDAWMVASESVALDVLEFGELQQLPPGEVLFFRAGEEVIRRRVAEARHRPCVFERIYFARPDSVMGDGRINRTRWLMGRRLAREWAARGLTADLVVAVPDTSRPAAMAMADELGLPNREGFIKNRYSGRTFIMPDRRSRDAALRLKLNPIREMFEGRRVLLVDDSIVRGTTMKRIVRMVRGLGPTALHLAIFSPPVAHPCFYGIDMPTRGELLAANIARDRLAEHLGADSVTFLSEEGMKMVAGQDICDACFTGRYSVPVSEDERVAIMGNRRPC